MYIKYPHSFRRNFKRLAVAALCLTASFGLGIQSAGDVSPITLIEAGSVAQIGDVDGSGIVDHEDAIVVLEITQGYRTATPAQLRLDPNGDGQFTVQDALFILSRL